MTNAPNESDQPIVPVVPVLPIEPSEASELTEPSSAKLSIPERVKHIEEVKQAALEKTWLPLWLPLAAALIALVFAALIIIKVGPSLSAMISPPEPVLPANSVLESHELNGTEDQWLYHTTTNGCNVAHVYARAFGACIYDPSSGCTSKDMPEGTPAVVPAMSSEVAECSGFQNIATYRIAWRVYIGSGTTGRPVIFRIYREVN